jgi:hypothetical protein
MFHGATEFELPWGRGGRLVLSDFKNIVPNYLDAQSIRLKQSELHKPPLACSCVPTWSSYIFPMFRPVHQNFCCNPQHFVSFISQVCRSRNPGLWRNLERRKENFRCCFFKWMISKSINQSLENQKSHVSFYHYSFLPWREVDRFFMTWLTETIPHWLESWYQNSFMPANAVRQIGICHCASLSIWALCLTCALPSRWVRHMRLGRNAFFFIIFWIL